MKKSVLTFLVLALIVTQSFAEAGYRIQIQSGPEIENLNGARTGIVEIDNLSGVIFSGNTQLCTINFSKTETAMYACGGSSHVNIGQGANGEIQAQLVKEEGTYPIVNVKPDEDLCTFDVQTETMKYQNSKVTINGSISSKFGKRSTRLCTISDKVFLASESRAQLFDCGSIGDDQVQEPILGKIYFYRKNVPDKGYEIILKGYLYYYSDAQNEYYYNDTQNKVCKITDKIIPVK